MRRPCTKLDAGPESPACNRQPVAIDTIVRGIPIRYSAELQNRPSQARSSPHNRNPGAAYPSQGKATAAAETSRHKIKFRPDGRVRHRAPIKWAVVLAFAHRHEEGWEFSDVRRLAPTRYRHDARPLLHTADRRPNGTTARKEDLREGRPYQRVSSNTVSGG